MKRRARYYSDEEVSEILRLYKEACKAALRQVKQHLADGHAFGHPVAGRAKSIYGSAACALAFEFKTERDKAEIVESMFEIGSGEE